MSSRNLSRYDGIWYMFWLSVIVVAAGSYMLFGEQIGRELASLLQ